MTEQKMPDISKMIGEMFSKSAISGEKPKWWQTYSYPEVGVFSIRKLMDYCRTALFFQASMHGDTIFEKNFHDRLDDTNNEEIEKNLTQLGCRLIYKLEANEKGLEPHSGMFFIYDSGAIAVIPNSVFCCGNDRKVFDKFCFLIEESFMKKS